jgi:hypothetical protein
MPLKCSSLEIQKDIMSLRGRTSTGANSKVDDFSGRVMKILSVGCANVGAINLVPEYLVPMWVLKNVVAKCLQLAINE